jgi:hypothetical protein
MTIRSLWRTPLGCAASIFVSTLGFCGARKNQPVTPYFQRIVHGPMAHARAMKIRCRVGQVPGLRPTPSSACAWKPDQGSGADEGVHPTSLVYPAFSTERSARIVAYAWRFRVEAIELLATRPPRVHMTTVKIARRCGARLQACRVEIRLDISGRRHWRRAPQNRVNYGVPVNSD